MMLIFGLINDWATTSCKEPRLFYRYAKWTEMLILFCEFTYRSF